MTTASGAGRGNPTVPDSAPSRHKKGPCEGVCTESDGNGEPEGERRDEAGAPRAEGNCPITGNAEIGDGRHENRRKVHVAHEKLDDARDLQASGQSGNMNDLGCTLPHPKWSR